MDKKKKPNNNIEILIVEDSPTQIEQLRHFLELHDYSVSTASNGIEGLATAKHLHPAVIISDIVMPEMDGFLLCKAIKSDEKLQDISVILLTSLSGPEDVINGLKCGADNFIRKPWDERYLLLRLNYILANREIRKRDKFSMGVELYIGGEKLLITAERQQIFDLLISTYEQAVQLNERLTIRDQQLDRANKILGGIYRIAKGLNSAMTQQEIIQHVLDRSLEMPDVRAGWLSLREGESSFRLVGSRGLPPALEVPGAMEGDCLCRRKTLAGEIDKSINITDCERLMRAKGDKHDLRSHVTVPLRIGNRVIGILNLVGSEETIFSDDDLAVLNGIGNQIGAALERTRMHEHLEELVNERTDELIVEIAERKRAEGKLRNAEARYRALYEQSPNGVLLIDVETRKIIEANETAYKQLGYTRDEFVALRISDYEAIEKPEETENHIQKIIREGSDTFETLHRTKNGEIRNVHAWIKTIRLGENLFFYAIYQEITDRKRSEKELTRLRKAVESSGEAIFLTDRDGIITYLNPEFTRIYGFTSDEVVGKATPQILNGGIEKPEEYDFIWKTILSNQVFKGEIINKAKDGRIVTTESSMNPIFDEQNDIIGFLAVQRDISERKRVEEERKSLQEQLIQTQKLESLGTLASGIAHDFNNILGIIMGYTHMIDNYRTEPEKFYQSVEAIKIALQRGASLVKQLLTFARKTDVTFTSVNINDTINEITKLIKETFPKTIVISTALQKDLPAIVADSNQIHQVILNLCVNARDAMPKNGTLSISTSIIDGNVIRMQFKNVTTQQFVKVEVSDTGIGMDESTRKRIFEPFFTTKDIGKGTGLGLATVFGIVERCNGFIDVKSTLGEGTRFAIYFPIPEYSPEISQSDYKQTTEIHGGTETILLIEDEEMLRELVKTLLMTNGYKVLIAEDGIHGVEMYLKQKNEIALVISDMGLPLLNGQDVAKNIRNINPTAKIIIASGFIDPEIKSVMLQSGIKHFVQKPYESNEILRKAREVIDSTNE